MSRDHRFCDDARRALYEAIYRRRDIREGYTGDPIDHDILARILQAAHHAGSVGFMQPWNFILIQNPERRQQLWHAVDKARRSAAVIFEGEQAEQFPTIKIDAVREASVVICITVDPSRRGPAVLGRITDEDTDLYSAACAVQNLWLAARTEGLGMGWVSFYRKPDIRLILGLPHHINPIGLMCLGPVESFPDRPVLESIGWGNRMPLEELIKFEHWDGEQPEADGPWSGMVEAVNNSNFKSPGVP